MDTIWLFIFAGSLLGLCLVLFKIKLRWLRYTLINMALAALFLFAINQTGLLGTYAVPVNLFTIGTVTLLGLPGVILIMGLKLVI